METIMNRKVTALSCAFISLVCVTPALAHHPGGVSNAIAAGPIWTISAATLEQGHAAAAFWYEYVRLGGLSDAQLIAAAAQHIHAHSIKTIQSPVASFAYGVTNDFTISIRAPYVRRTDIREGHHSHDEEGNTVEVRGDSSGFGDVTLLGQWRFFNNVISQTQAAVLLGVKAPTGRTNVHDNQGLLFETEFQPGTGSWDGLFGGAFTQGFGRWSFDNNLLYIATSTGAQETNMGNRFLYNAALSYRVFGGSVRDGYNALAHSGHSHSHPAPVRKAPVPVTSQPGWSLDAILELNGEWHDHQKVAGVIDPNSGGNTVYLAPGLRATYDRFSSFALVGVPIANHMNGLQSKPDYKVLFGMAVAF
jgi:Putative MetA-pathway of phenol degradation